MYIMCLSLSCRHDDWYRCLTVLHKLNPAIIEPYLSTLLQKTVTEQQVIVNIVHSHITNNQYIPLNN